MSSEQTKKSLIIDGNHLVYRCWHTTAGQSLRTKAGRSSGIVHEFLRSYCHLRKVFDPIDHIYVTWDRRSRHRKRLLDTYRAALANQPGPIEERLLEVAPHMYKESRYQNRSDEDHAKFQNVLLPQMQDIEHILPSLGARNLRITETEGDDLIGIASDILSVDGDVVIVSSDRDLYQLLNDRVALYDPIKKKFFRKGDFETKFGIPPDRYPEIKSLMGDDHDDIPGVPRIGEKTAIKLIREADDLVNLFKICEDAPKKPIMRTLPEWRKQVELAYEMSFIMSSYTELDADQQAEFLTAWALPARTDWQDVNTFCEVYELNAAKRELHHLLVGRTEESDLASCKSLDELFERWGDCARCPLHQSRVHLVKYGGSATATIALIGEGPSASDDILGEPIVGKAGRYLESKQLAPNGLKRSDIHIMNIICCRPVDPNGLNRAPAREEISSCHPRLFHQLRIVNPRVAVLIGDKALKVFFPKSAKISQERGAAAFMTHEEFPGIKFVTVFHPSYLMQLRPDHSDVVKSRIDWKYIGQMATHI